MDNMFNPFNKKIEDITFDDLHLLIDNDVPEGYFVEYKSDFQDSKKIAKSIAAFANSYGGWYFIGIDDENGTNVAKDIVGFDVNKHNQPKESIRQIVRERIHPIPYFVSKLLIDGNGKNVLVVYIPQSIEAPHIVDGIVCVRNGEESSPIKDKHSLDILYQRGALFEAKVNAYLQNPFCITEVEQKRNEPTINLCFIPKSFMYVDKTDFYESTFLDKLFELVNQIERLDSIDEEMIFEFVNVVRTPHSIIFHDTIGVTNYYNLVLEFFYNGAARIQIPISYETPKTPFYEDSEYIQCLENQPGDGLISCRLVDLAQTSLILEHTIKKYIGFLTLLKPSNDAFVTVWEMRNIFRLIPFVEAKSFLEHVGKYGVPISMYGYKKIQDELSGRKWDEYKNFDTICSDILEQFLMILGLSKDTELFTDSMEFLLTM